MGRMKCVAGSDCFYFCVWCVLVFKRLVLPDKLITRKFHFFNFCQHPSQGPVARVLSDHSSAALPLEQNRKQPKAGKSLLPKFLDKKLQVAIKITANWELQGITFQQPLNS